MIHLTLDAMKTVCGQTAGLNCVGPEDAQAVNCPACRPAQRPIQHGRTELSIRREAAQIAQRRMWGER